MLKEKTDLRILVLGSAGLIGSAVTEELQNRAITYKEFDIRANLEQDLRVFKNPLLKNAIEWCTHVIFLAYDIGGSKYLSTNQDKLQFISNNVRIMESTFSEIALHRKPVIFASTQMSNDISSPYGCLKRLGEFYTFALSGKIVKFWNVYGYEADSNRSHVVSDFIRSAAKNRSINVLTNGSEARQFIHSKDAACGLIACVNHYDELPIDVSIDITNHYWTTIKTISEKIADRFPGTEINFSQLDDMVQNSKRNEADKTFLKYWKPLIGLEEGIDLTWNKMRENEIE
jgi:nucleoside-diphosphate-sugar epimerase